MKILFIIFSLALFFHQCQSIRIISRSEWRADNAKSFISLSTPVPYVVIHHSEESGCNSETSCKRSVKNIQKYHMKLRPGIKFKDIGYNFLVGGDSQVYEGTGWNKRGIHAKDFNPKSIGICVLGTFHSKAPPSSQLDAVKELISEGVSMGIIASDYKLKGHRQVNSGKTCPGNKLFEEIKNWDNFEL